MADFQQPEGHLNGGGVGALGGADRLGVGPTTVTSSEAVGSKRQRRPSVRLGDIGGDQFDDTHHRRTNSSRQYKHNDLSESSKTRALTNLTTTGEFAETLDDNKEANLDPEAIGSWKVRDLKKRASSKRVRSNWAAKIDDAGGGNHSGGEDMEDTYREFNMENSESPLKEQSQIHSVENLGDGNERNEREMCCNRRSIRVRENHNHYRNGLRIWLDSIGLGRYAAVFEIHEVDDEVLPMLTLEDLKDMGINAVGSRRKMFCAIQKLGEGFS